MKLLTIGLTLFCINHLSAQTTDSLISSAKLTGRDPGVSSLDSLVRSFFTAHTAGMDSLSSPSVPDSLSFSTTRVRDSLVKGLRATTLSGTLGIKHEFGLLAAYTDSSGALATHVFSTQGAVTVTSLGLPVNVSYNYSNFRNPLGVNNYFRASLDLEKLII